MFTFQNTCTGCGSLYRASYDDYSELCKKCIDQENESLAEFERREIEDLDSVDHND